MSAYQKVYMNQIHSSSLLCQLAHMWKSNLLCDAIIRTGPVITKAHRVVLVAACPMLQSMENASAGSHLEVRLAADIKQDSVNTFLQYLYEGFMMLTEENVREVEKIGRLLQVDSVTKCCVDFYKCLQGKTGAPVPGSSYKFSVNDTVEFRHVRATELQKTVQDRMMKRTTDFSRPGSPGNKRQRLQRNGSPDLSSFSGDKADDTVSMTNSYLAPDPWERVPRLGAGGNKSNKAPGVINMVEESIELVQTEPSEKETLNSQTHKTSVSLSVASQYNTEPNVSVVNVHQERDLPLTNSTPSHSARGSITVSPLTIFSENNNSENALSEQMRHESEVVFPERIKVTSTPRSSSHQNKPFAAGSANQASPGMIPKHMPRPPAMTSSQMESASPMDGEHRSSGANSQAEESPEDTSPDLSIVKVEKAEDIGLDMHIDVHDTGSMHLHKNRIMHSHDGDEGPDPSEQEMEDWAREEMSNEGSNVSGDQSNSWYMGTFKGPVHALSSLASCSDYAGPCPPIVQTGPDLAFHRPVKSSTYKTCALCHFNKTKTRSGWRVYTYFKCETCDVALCDGVRNCFRQFHCLSPEEKNTVKRSGNSHYSLYKSLANIDTRAYIQDLKYAVRGELEIGDGKSGGNLYFHDHKHVSRVEAETSVGKTGGNSYVQAFKGMSREGMETAGEKTGDIGVSHDNRQMTRFENEALCEKIGEVDCSLGKTENVKNELN